jgi:hypothetical protein
MKGLGFSLLKTMFVNDYVVNFSINQSGGTKGLNCNRKKIDKRTNFPAGKGRNALRFNLFILLRGTENSFPMNTERRGQKLLLGNLYGVHLYDCQGQLPNQSFSGSSVFVENG